MHWTKLTKEKEIELIFTDDRKFEIVTLKLCVIYLPWTFKLQIYRDFLYE